MGDARLAVLKSYCLWAWIEKQENAIGIPGIKGEYVVQELIPSGWFFYCPLCELVGNSKDTLFSSGVCDFCPMKGRWPSVKMDGNVLFCYSVGSVYKQWGWVYVNNTRLAGDIAASLWKLYKELEEV